MSLITQLRKVKLPQRANIHTSFVGADDVDTAQGLHYRQPLHYNSLLSHTNHSQRQRYRDNDGETFWDGSHCQTTRVHVSNSM